MGESHVLLRISGSFGRSELMRCYSGSRGHSSIKITLDRYGHLMPGNEDEAVQLVDSYLERTAKG